jgi:hypothetical protein
MMRHMIRHERLDEPVRMIVPRMPPQRQPLAGGLGRRLQQLRLELQGQELVAQALVDQELAGQRPAAAQQLAGVVLGPGGAV